MLTISEMEFNIFLKTNTWVAKRDNFFDFYLFLDVNSDLLFNFDDYGLEMILHYQDHGLAAIFSDGRVLPGGSSTDFKIKIEEVIFERLLPWTSGGRRGPLAGQKRVSF
jgi:hypothetical protein